MSNPNHFRKGGEHMRAQLDGPGPNGSADDLWNVAANADDDGQD